MSNKQEQWSSRWGFIAASMGMAIGTGNIWRFPRVAASNGGGPFLIAWTVALFVWAIPLLMGEMVIGRKTGLGTIGAFRDFVGRKFAWMGTWIAIVCMAIMFYYSVIMGWCMKYFTLAASGTFKSGMSTEATQKIWNTFTTTPSQTIAFHFLAICIAGIIIYKGINGGIEKVSKIMIPILFILMIAAVFRSVTLQGATKGLEYFFSPKLHMLKSSKIWLEAFTQAAWSTGAGWGFIITYAVYTSKKEDISGNCMIMGFGNNVGSLIAGLTIIPAIFALSPNQDFINQAIHADNQGLAFIYLAQIFPTMPGGRILASIFFLAMSIAALSSLLPMIEVGVRNLMDMGMNRNKATRILIIGGFLFGIPSAYSLDFLNNQDFILGIGLLVSGLFVAFAIIKYGLEEIRTNLINTPWSDIKIGKWWNACMNLIPALFFIITGWWMWQVIGWYPDSWWNPFEIYSIGAILLQFILFIGLALLTNNFLVRRVGKGRDITQDIPREEQ